MTRCCPHFAALAIVVGALGSSSPDGRASAQLPPTIRSVAGTGEPGYSGDGGRATLARLREPFHVSFGPRGEMYVAEAGNHCIRRVDPATGVIRTVAGCGRKGYSGDGGPATAATMNEPYGIVADS